MFTIKFKDPQGTTYEAAIVAVRSLSGNINSSANMNLDITDRTDPKYTSQDTGNKFANYSAVYWSSQASYDSGYAPYVLYAYDDINSGNTNFSFELTGEYSELDYISAAELHLQTEVLDTVFPQI